MFSILGTIIIVASLHLVSARNDSLSKTYRFSNQNLILADTSFDNRTLFYGLFTQSSKRCSVVQEINPFTNYTITRKCDFTVKADGVQLIVAFGTEKAILIMQEATPQLLRLKATTVHMDGCKTVQAELVDVPLNWTNRKLYRDYIDVVVFDQGFEVIIKGLSRLCTKPDARIYCGSSFDADGNRIEGPLIWPKMAYDKIDLVSPVMADASGQGYFFVNRDPSLLAFQVNRKGGPKYVKLWYTPVEHTDLWREGFSVANKVDGMCYNVNSTIGCWQTDREGELKINVEFEFDHKFKANLRQCNTTLSSKVQDTMTTVTEVVDATTEVTTTEAITIEDATVEETTMEDITSPEETTEIDVTSEAATIMENITEETAEDVVMEPITVEGIAEVEIATQDAEMQNSTVPDDAINEIITTEDTVQENVSSGDNATASNVIHDSTAEEATIANNGAQETVMETDELENNTSHDSGVQEGITADGFSLDNATEDNNAALENLTDYNTVPDITVQGLTTEPLTTEDTAMQEDVNVTESIIPETSEGASQDITVQGITTTVKDITTQKVVVRRSITGEHKIWNLFIHNLRNGGFVILIVTCPNRICSGNEDHYYLMKINAQGKLYGQLEVNVKSKCNAEKNEVFAKVFENDQGQYCSVRLCKSKESKEEQLETLVNCYCNSDFK